MAWRELVTGAYRERAGASVSSFPRFEPGATEVRLQQAERTLGQAFPDALRTFLSECDGIMDVMEMDGRLIETGWLMWTVDAIVEGHSEPSRATLGPPDSWLVFANAGADGILFANDCGETKGHIWAWHSIEGRPQHMAESLAVFLRGWITGEVAV